MAWLLAVCAVEPWACECDCWGTVLAVHGVAALAGCWGDAGGCDCLCGGCVCIAVDTTPFVLGHSLVFLSLSWSLTVLRKDETLYGVSYLLSLVLCMPPPLTPPRCPRGFCMGVY
jgi:hypothetical protein